MPQRFSATTASIKTNWGYFWGYVAVFKRGQPNSQEPRKEQCECCRGTKQDAARPALRLLADLLRNEVRSRYERRFPAAAAVNDKAAQRILMPMEMRTKFPPAPSC